MSQQLLNQLKTLERRMHSPKTDLVETQTSYIIRMELAVKDFEWNIKDQQYLFVSYVRDQDYGHEDDSIKVIYSETKYGKNIRRVKLPSKISGEVLRETWDYGVWIIEFAKEGITPSTASAVTASPILAESPRYEGVEDVKDVGDLDFLQNEPFQPIEMGSWADL
jgi:HSP20 family molecular chaperone IbpA